MELFEVIEEIKVKVKDNAAVLDRGDLESITIGALTQFSKDKPREVVADIDGDGGYDYDLPSTWSAGFSQIKAVEYPAGERVPLVLDSDRYDIYKTAVATKLRFVADTPQSGETVRLTFTTVYLKSTIDQIPAHLQDPFCTLAASLCCGVISRHYSGTQGSAIRTDAVDFQSKGKEFSDRARELLGQYNNAVGKKGGTAAAASGVKNFDRGSSLKTSRLTHKD